MLPIRETSTRDGNALIPSKKASESGADILDRPDSVAVMYKSSGSNPGVSIIFLFFLRLFCLAIESFIPCFRESLVSEIIGFASGLTFPKSVVISVSIFSGPRKASISGVRLMNPDSTPAATSACISAKTNAVCILNSSFALANFSSSPELYTSDIILKTRKAAWHFVEFVSPALSISSICAYNSDNGKYSSFIFPGSPFTNGARNAAS